MTAPFEPKAEDPQWRLVADFMRSIPKDGVATHAEMAAAAGCTERGVSAIVGMANQKLREEGLRLVAVPGVGYRWATPLDIADEATRGRQLRIRRGITRLIHSATAWRNHEDASDDDRRMASEVELTAREVARVQRKASATVRGYRPERPVFRKSED